MNHDEVVCNLRQIIGKYPLTHDEWQAIENAIISLNSVLDFQKNDIDRLERRLKHLLQSEFIRSFDEVDARTKEYKRDIREADNKNTGGCGTWEIQYFDNTPRFFICSNCKSRLSYRYNFCPCCGSDNRA